MHFIHLLLPILRFPSRYISKNTPPFFPRKTSLSRFFENQFLPPKNLYRSKKRTNARATHSRRPIHRLPLPLSLLPGKSSKQHSRAHITAVMSIVRPSNGSSPSARVQHIGKSASSSARPNRSVCPEAPPDGKKEQQQRQCERAQCAQVYNGNLLESPELPFSLMSAYSGALYRPRNEPINRRCEREDPRFFCGARDKRGLHGFKGGTRERERERERSR